jgi:hypothetical protein
MKRQIRVALIFLAALFDDQAVFVHMGGTMSRSQELDVIKGGMIQYKNAETHGTWKQGSLSFTRLLTPP